jgi:hypothetical protein
MTKSDSISYTKKYSKIWIEGLGNDYLQRVLIKEASQDTFKEGAFLEVLQGSCSINMC